MPRGATRREAKVFHTKKLHTSAFNVSESSYHQFFAAGRSLEVK